MKLKKRVVELQRRWDERFAFERQDVAGLHRRAVSDPISPGENACFRSVANVCPNLVKFFCPRKAQTTSWLENERSTYRSTFCTVRSGEGKWQQAGRRAAWLAEVESDAKIAELERQNLEKDEKIVELSPTSTSKITTSRAHFVRLLPLQHFYKIG